MTIDIELLLARHPLLFFRRKCHVKGFDCGGVITAICGGGRNVHPLSTVKSTGNKLRNEQSRWEVAFSDKADVLLFAAHKTTANVVAGIAEIDVHVILCQEAS